MQSSFVLMWKKKQTRQTRSTRAMCLAWRSPFSFDTARVAWRNVACVAWRFWLGALSNKVGRGQRNREEIGAEATWKTYTGFYFSRGFAARSRALRARISRLPRSSARLNKTAMLRRLDETSLAVRSKERWLFSQAWFLVFFPFLVRLSRYNKTRQYFYLESGS